MPKRSRHSRNIKETIVYGLILMFIIPTIGLTGWGIIADPPIKLDLTLTLSSTLENLEYSASYTWNASKIDTSAGVANIQWNSKFASATVNSQGQITEAIKGYFEKVTISFETTLLDDNGDWSVDLHKQLCSGITLGVGIIGDDSEVTEITPYLEACLMPVTLKNTLRSFGLSEVDMTVKINFHIRGDLLDEAARNLGLVIHFWSGMMSKSVEVSLGTLSVITD